MPERNFMEMLSDRWDEGKFVCVGLDSDIDRIPGVPVDWPEYKSRYQLSFNQQIVNATSDLVCAFKLNEAFYIALGSEGIKVLEDTVKFIREWYPDVPVILDAKRGDKRNTNVGYVKFAFDVLDADAITVHPYLGQEAMKPFLDRADKGIIVLCRTSNSGAGEFQDLEVTDSGSADSDRQPLYQRIAQHVAEDWNYNGNCAVVVGATYPRELAEVRQIVGDMPILIPGTGAQGGEVKTTIKAGQDSQGKGMIINASRSIIFASSESDFDRAARLATMDMHAEITRHLKMAKR